MTKIRLDQLVWDDWNIEHIKKHNVLRIETEDAINNIRAHRQGYDGRVILIGRSGARILAVLVKKEKAGEYYVITVRDADKKERKLLYEKEGRKNP